MTKTEKQTGSKVISLMLALIMIISGVIAPTGANTISVKAAETIQISSASELPTVIEAGKTYELTADIQLPVGQQIANMAGTLDGKGHTVTLADKPLIAEASGMIQNIIIEGDITSSADYRGSMVTFLNGGTIRNSASKVNQTLGVLGADGGIVGRSENGKIFNTYYSGSASGEYIETAGMIGQSNQSGKPSTIKNCYYTGGKENPVNFGNAYNQNDPSYGRKTMEELKLSASLLNNEIQNTGFRWESNGNTLPYLVRNDSKPTEPQETDFSKLSARIEEVKAMDKTLYTAETWEAVEAAVQAGEKVLKDQSADQKTVNEALKNLNAAVDKLLKMIPTKAVKMPEESQIIPIRSVDDLVKIGSDSEGKFYRLENDITIKESDWYFPPSVFKGVFDGNGHVVNFENSYVGLFDTIGRNAVVQNTQFAGTLMNTAPAGNSLYGAVINCLSTVTGDSVGLVNRLANGVISNCAVTGKAAKGLITDYGKDNYESDEISKYVGKIYNTYWLKSSKDPVISSEDLLLGSGGKTENDLKSKAIVRALNEHAGENAIEWGQNGTTGFPYFGEDQIYDPDKIDLPDSKYTVRFGTTKEDAVVITDKRLDVSRNDLTSSSNSIIGQFFIDGVDSKDVSWSVHDVKNDSIDINKQTGTDNNGKLHIFHDGEGIVKAQVKGEDAVWIKVFVNSKAVEDFKLFIDGEDVTNGKYTVQGSEWTDIKIKAKHEGEDEYRNVFSGVFDFKYQDNQMIHNEGSASFSFNRPGTSSVTIESKENRDKKATIELTSEFVPIESIRPDIPDVNYLHARASMTDGKQFDAIETNGVTILPENASNKKGFDVSSSNPEVAKFTPTLPLGYLPFNQGETTFTAFMDDTNPLTGETRRVEGTRTVSFKYKNPLTKIHVGKSEVEVKEFEKVSLDLGFEGELSKDGWSVSEPGLEWTFSEDGIVSIDREKLHAQNRDENAPDGEKGYWIATTDYQVEGLREGTVTATGTPIDKTNNVEPVVITIHVTKGNAVHTDVEELADKGRNTAGSAIIENHKNKGYVFGDEWDVFALTRAGVKLTENEKDGYYRSVVDTVKHWNKDTKPTDIERVMLALAVIDKDVTDVGGVNLEEMLLSSQKLNEGSNELTFAIIALKVAGCDVPQETMDKLVEDLLKFQNTDGGYALFPRGESGVDTTAMSLQALALYRESVIEGDTQKSDKVNDSIHKGLEYLKTQLSASFDAGNSEAVSQVIIALTSLDINPATEKGFSNGRKNMITALMEYCIEGEGFAHTKNLMKVNAMATNQAFQALESFRRYMAGEPSYWQVQEKDAKPTPEIKPVPKPEPDQKPVPDTKPEPDTKPVPDQKPAPNKKPVNVKKPQSSQSKAEVKELEVKDQDLKDATVSKEDDYKITAMKKDREKIDKLNLEIIDGSKYDDKIKQLAKNPFTFRFNTDEEFGTEVMVEMKVNLADGEYILFSYNDDTEKLEVIQKVTVEDGKTKFIVSKGGDYCIAEMASTESLKNETDAAEENQTNIPIMAGIALAAVVAVLAGIGFKKRKEK